jgi:hypothetical protein
MTDLVDRYPIATADGREIPLDTVRPAGCYVVDISNIATSPQSFTSSYKTIAVYATVDCVIRFGAAAAVQSSWLSEGFYIPKETIITLSPTSNSFSAITVNSGSTGKLAVSVFENWAGLGLETQYGRR